MAQAQSQSQAVGGSGGAPQWGHGWVPLNSSAQQVKSKKETAAQARAKAKKVVNSASTKPNYNIKVPQSVVDQLRRGNMAQNIAYANSGKASPLYVEAAKRFYPGKVTGGHLAAKKAKAKKVRKSKSKTQSKGKNK